MNILPRDKQITIISALTEGCSIRAIERMTGVHRDTIMRLAVRVGNHCVSLMDGIIRNVPAGTVEIDEVWTYVRMKDRQMIKSRYDGPKDVGSQFVAIAMDRDTKLVIAHDVGKRVPGLAMNVVKAVSERIVGKPTIITDGWDAYTDAVWHCFRGDGAHFGQLVKTVKESRKPVKEGYQPAKVITCKEYSIFGRPETAGISTSRIERQNWTLRTHVRRLTRLSNGFSRKLENLVAAIALHFAAYNLTKRHAALGMTPAMAAGIADKVWTISDLVPV